MRLFALALVAAALAVPAAASAQHVSHARGPVWDRFSLEPYVGRYYDNSGSGESGFHDHGWMGGLRVGLAVADRARLVGDFGYAQVDAVARSGTDQAAVFGSQNWLVTGGFELDLVPGDTRGTVSLLGGRVWRDLRQQGWAGEGPGPAAPPIDSPVTTIVPGFSIQQRFAPRADLRIGIQDYILVGADPVSHNWALTAGITLR
jgi:opacity protein-like surface antigen